MEETRSQIEIEVTLNEDDVQRFRNLVMDIDPHHIPAALSLFQNSELLESLVKFQSVFVKTPMGGRLEVRLTPTPLLQFFAS